MTADCSPDGLRAVLGDAAYAACVQAALDAPEPSEAIKERVRQLFGPGMRQLSEADRRSPALIAARAA